MCYGMTLPITGGRCYYENYIGDCTKRSNMPCPVTLEEEIIILEEKKEEEKAENERKWGMVEQLDYLSDAQQNDVFVLLNGEVSPSTFTSVQQLIAQCFNKPDYYHKLLTALNEVTEGHGVESFTLTKEGEKIVVEYINQGDTYVPTILFEVKTKKLMICSYGDYIESFERGETCQAF